MKIALPLEVVGLTLNLRYSTILYSGSTDVGIQFTLDAFWKSLENKTVIFQKGMDFYEVPLETDNVIYYCIIPEDVIAEVGHIRVGLRGGDVVCTNMLSIDVYQGATEYYESPMVDPICLREMCRERSQELLDEWEDTKDVSEITG